MKYQKAESGTTILPPSAFNSTLNTQHLTLNSQHLTLLYTPPQGYIAAIDKPEAFAAYEATFPPKEKKVLPTQLFPE